MGTPVLVLGAFLLATAAPVAVVPRTAVEQDTAQRQTASVSGRVVGDDGVGLEGARVSLRRGSGVLEARTDATGRYRLDGVPAGRYELRIEADGFDIHRRRGLVLGTGRRARIDVGLAPAQVSSAGGLDDGGALPAARDVWAHLEHRTPGLVTDRFDVGGSAIGSQAAFSARGSSWTQNDFYLDGTDVSDPGFPGTSTFYFDYGALDALEVSTHGHPVGHRTPGVHVTLAVRGGGSEVHGGGSWEFENSALQADPSGRGRAAAGVPLAIDYLSDAGVHLGGPAGSDRLRWFAAYRDWRIERQEDDVPEGVGTELPVLTAKLRYELADQRFFGLFSRQGYSLSHRRSGPRTAPEASWVEDSETVLAQAGWSGSSPRHHRAELRASVLDAATDLRARPGVTGQSRFDLVTGLTSGPARFETGADRRRVVIRGAFSTRLENGRGSHELDAGAEYTRASGRLERRVRDDVSLVTSAGIPFFALLYNTPVINEQHVRSFAVYGQDQWSVGERLTLLAGLRWDLIDGSLPAQESPAGTFVPARGFAAAEDRVSWNRIAPRISLTVDLFGDGRSVVDAGWSAYSHTLGTALVAATNPNGLASTTVPWSDPNGNGRFDAGEATLTGPLPAGFVEPDSALQSPITHELRLGIFHELTDRWNGELSLIYRRTFDLVDDVETALDADADFQAITVADPGPDNVFGTGDERGLTVLNQVSAFGESRRVLANVDSKEATYRGIELGLQRELAGGWQLDATLVLGLAEGLGSKSGVVPGDPGGISDLFDTPNAQINADARLFWHRPWVLKVAGTYRLPFDLEAGARVRSQAGAPLARILPVPLNQGLVEVFADPRGFDRLDPVTTVDARLSRPFSLGRRATLRLALDVFNVGNSDTVIEVSERSPSFGTPLSRLAPRTLRIGLAVGF